MSARFILFAACMLAGCTVLRPKEPFSEAALLSDDASYVAHRYAKDALGVELRADLIAAGYACEPAPSGGHVCSRSAPAAPGCADVYTVRVDAPRVEAVQHRRCAGVVSPP
jgi:hypothetical protein